MMLAGAFIDEAWVPSSADAPLGAGAGAGYGALMSPLSHNGRGVHHTLPAEAVFRRQIPRDEGVTRYPVVPTGMAIPPIN